MDVPETVTGLLMAALGVESTVIVALWRRERKWEARIVDAEKACDGRIATLEKQHGDRIGEMERRLVARIVELERKIDEINEKRVAELKYSSELGLEVVERNTKVLERVLDRISRNP